MIKRLVTTALIIFILFLGFSLTRQIHQALEASKRLDAAANTFSRAQDENRRLKQRLKEVETDDFIEQEARNKLNLSKPGETVVVIPQEDLDRVAELFKEKKEVKIPNWQKWLRLIFQI